MRKTHGVGRRFLFALLGAAAAALLAAGCPSTVNPADWTLENGTGGSSEKRDDLFIQQADPAVWVFSTNDTAYWGPNGYTLWSLPLAGEDPFLARDVELVKTSGNGWAGFGIAFCHAAAAEGQEESMLLAIINTRQQYSLGEVNGASYRAYTPSTWVSHASLSPGYGMANRVKVTRDAGGQFTLYLNQVQVMTFHDGRTPAPTGGAGGYLVVISPQDSFPRDPVSVTFTEK